MAKKVFKKEKLNPSQRRFVQEYLKDQNATQAYLRVYGGSQKSAEAHGPRLVGHGRVKIEIEKGMARLADRANITAERNLRRIAEIAYHDRKAGRHEILKACELIGKTFGQFKEVVETKVDANVTTVDKTEARKVIDELESEC